ncbi:aspartate--tRNA ligase [Candidatus Uhrbacteria bacterium]|nr:aspartate--tRNA ligase [Candidatus Uhrbacteria bacterium]
MLRTHTCGELDALAKGTDVTLAGWVGSRRDHGGLIFIDLRDRYGITQVVFHPDKNPKAYDIANKARPEHVLLVRGTVLKRPDEMVNEKIPTGTIEVEVMSAEILSPAKTPPFEIEAETEPEKEVNEERRMQYRYLDLRRSRMKRNMAARNAAVFSFRSVLQAEKFLEIETPLLTKSTPEGARDYLVPSRQHPGMFYSLPQSPQQYKQLLMVGGIDRYFQVAKCLRDEDTRGDRQAEFTQLDIELSFVERDDVLNLVERLIRTCITTLSEKGFIKKRLLYQQFPRIPYDEVMLKYGVDKPDLRFGMEIYDITETVRGCGFSVFTDAISLGGVVRALCIGGGVSRLTRSAIDELTELVRKYGAKGLAFIKVKEKRNDGSGFENESPILKYLDDDVVQRIITQLQATSGDIIFFGADARGIVQESLGQLRAELGKRLDLIDPDVLAPAFVIDFPLFEPDRENGHYAPMHHMFTMPRSEDLALLDTDPHRVKSWQYDTVMNGYEIGGGSIRIHRKDIQEKIFERIGFSEERRAMFTHMLEAFEYGAPPHGGIALGIDRLLMILLGEPSIREVIAFPKTGDGRDLTVGAPNNVEQSQLKELGLKIHVKP